MARLDEYIFGYNRVRVAKKDIPVIANALLKLGICSTVSSDGEFILRHKDKARFLSYAGALAHFDPGPTLGLRGFLIGVSHRYGMLLGLLASILIFIFSSGLVWDVRISGNDRLSEYKLEQILDNSGLSVGTSWRKLDKNDLESSILSQNPDVAWIAVNRRGTVAYVEIIESENVGISEPQLPLYSNVIAECDGVIEEITVKSGSAVVKVGDVVKAGDVLISGVIDTERGTQLCRAEGIVRALSAIDVSTEVKEQSVERIVTGHKIAQIKISLFNFSINIFKNYRNSVSDCDIIEEIRKFALFDKYKLPVKLIVNYRREYTEQEKTLTSDEMTSAARRELEGKIYSMFKDADVVKLRTSGEFSGGVYRLVSRVVYSTDIGKESAIEIS